MAFSKSSNKRVPSDINRIFAGIGLSILTALMLIFAFHPFNVWFLAFIAIVPMLTAQYRILPRNWAGLAPTVGIGGWLLTFLITMFEGSGFGWLIIIIIAVIILLQLLMVPVVRRFHRGTGYRWFVLQGVADWVGFEMIRSFIPPINTHAFIAQTMYTQPWILQPLSIFSIYGLGIVLMLVNFALARVVIRYFTVLWYPDAKLISKKGTFKWLIVSGSVLILWIFTSLIILSNSHKNPDIILVGAIQHNFPIPAHQDSLGSQKPRFQELCSQARIASDLGARLIVFPELGINFDPQRAYSDEFRRLASETNAYLLIGYGIDDPKGWRNEVVMLTPDGKFLAVYGKNHPTTPGEPPIITSGVYPVYNTELGKIAPIICNDVNWTNTSRILARKGAQLIAVPTLETPGTALEQVAQSVLRAVENRVTIVKADAAYSSAIIDPFGRIIAMRNGSPRGEAYALVSKVSLGTSTAIYTYLGDWPGWICLLGMITFNWLQIRYNRKHKHKK